MQVQRPGTGPLTSPIPPQRPEFPRQPEATSPAVTEDQGPGIDNQTQVYGETAIGDPGAVQFPTGRTGTSSLNPMRERYLNTLESLVMQGVAPTDDQNTAQFLSDTLGFQNPEMMMHHLRNLSPTQKTQLMDNLRSQLGQKQLPDTAITQAFEAVFTEGINSLAAEHGAPPPRLTPEGSGWNTAGLASVYNAMHTIQAQSPERLATVLERPGLDRNGQRQPLTFNRESAPEVHSNPDRFMDGLTDASRIAHADPNNGIIHLYDTAISGDHTDITRNIVGKLDLLSRIDPHNGRELSPLYTREELSARGLNRQSGERNDVQHAVRLRQTVQGEWTERFGGWENTQKALNFLIRFKGLDNPEVVNPPLSTVEANGNPNDPATVAQINRLGVNNLQMLMARMEQQDAVAQMQGFLAENAPPGSPARELSTDGLLGPQTRQVVLGFETALGLNTLRERIEDDANIPETRKVELVQYLNGQFGRLAGDHTQSAQITRDVTQHIQSLLAEEGLEMAPHTRSGLESDLQNMRALGDGHFDRESAEHLVNSWFNVMDSGQGQDLAEQLLVHEMGHFWESELNANTDLDIRSNWSQFFRPEQLEGEAGHSIHHINQNDYNDTLHNDRTAASAYGAVNPEEDFAEASRVFSYDPQRLMRRSLTKFLVMNSLNDNRYSAEQIRTMATECGYRPEDVLQRLDSILGHGNQRLNFTLPLSQRLNTDYAELRSQLQSAVGSGDTSAPTPGPESPPTLPEMGVRSISPLGAVSENTATTPGERFEQLSERYAELYEQLAQPVTNRAAIEAEIQQLNQEVLGQVDPQLSAILQQRQLGDTPESGGALIAALAIYRATGEFDRDAHPDIAQHLHPGVDLALQNPRLQGALTDRNFEVNALLERSLDFCQQGVQRFDQIQRAFEMPGNERLNDIRTRVKDLVEDVKNNQISEADFHQGVHELFQDRRAQTLMNGVLNIINRGVQTMMQTTGQRFPQLNMQQFQEILVRGAEAEVSGRSPVYEDEIMHALEGARYTG